MNDLLKKLNTLMRAQLGDLTPDLPSFPRRPDLDGQVEDMRARINDALAHEDQLMAKVQALRTEAERLDADADAALSRGDQTHARHLLMQLQRTEQRLTIAEADLRSHQRAAEELIRQVNVLEATIADAKASAAPAAPQSPPPRDADTPQPPVQQEPARADSLPQRRRTVIQVEADDDDTPAEAAPTTHDVPVDSDDTAESGLEDAQETAARMDSISGMLRDAQTRTRARIEAMDKALGTSTPAPTPAKRPDDTMQGRISRLSGPGPQRPPDDDTPKT